jgi:DNA-binding response OmpR family regulator
MKYLIADDDPFVCEQIERYLATLPDTEYCLQAGDGLVALQILSTGDLDAAFVDWQMPHLDGADLLRALPDRLPVIVVSARTDLESQFSPFGHVAYLHKPLEPRQILQAVEKVRALAA